MKKRIVVLLVVAMIATSLFASELAPYKCSEAKRLGWNNSCTLKGEVLKSGLLGYNRVGYALYNLNNNYRELSVTIGIKDDYRSSGSASVSFYVDGIKLNSYTFSKGDNNINAVIDLGYRQQLKIVIDEGIVLCNFDFK